MKTIKIFTSIFFFTVTTSLYAQDKTATFKVSGVCSMCKKTIEKAGKASGVKTINWDENTQQAKVQFDSKLTSIDAIQKNIAAVGYDTEKYKATDKAFQNLPDCCQYERTKQVKN